MSAPVKLGAAVRTMGPQATRETVVECARAAEELGLDELYVPDHIAIPPDDAEGSDGRYLDPLGVLLYLAAATERIALGTAVLVLPYRPALPTAKVIATLQEFSGNRLILGVGVGWMVPEFVALGVDPRRRGAQTDAVLDFLVRAFGADDDVVEAHGQPFLFRPRPPRPPIFVGGMGPHALHRTLRFGDGWMPIGSKPEAVAGPYAELRERFGAAGRGEPELVIMTGLRARDPQRLAAEARAWAELGATRLVYGAGRYADAAEFRRGLEVLAGPVRSALA